MVDFREVGAVVVLLGEKSCKKLVIGLLAHGSLFLLVWSVVVLDRVSDL